MRRPVSDYPHDRCPFCDSDDLIFGYSFYPSENHWDKRRGHYSTNVRCNKCYAEGPYYLYRGDKMGNGEEEAVKLWNDRQQPKLF